MNKLLILTKNTDYAEYQHQIEAAHLPKLQLIDKIAPDVNIVLGEPTRIRDSLAQLPALKWVQSSWAGIEPLLEPNLPRNYTLTNARGVFGELMSEFVFSYLLLFERKTIQRLEAQKQAHWDASRTGSLRGKTIGLLGVGSIGAHLASTAKHFGMHVRGYTRASETCADVNFYYHGKDLLTFAQGLDSLVCVLPNTPETYQIIDAQLLNCLPAYAIVINAGRGSAVDETALITALEQEKLGGAVLDVFEQEPLPAEHPFWRTKNLFITSHSAAPSFPQHIARLFIENYHLFISKQALKYQVDFMNGY